MAPPSATSTRIMRLLLVLVPTTLITLLVIIWLRQDRPDRDRAPATDRVAETRERHAAKEQAIAEARHSREVETQALATAEEQRRRADKAQEEIATLRAGDPGAAAAADLRKQLQAAEAELVTLRAVDAERRARDKDIKNPPGEQERTKLQQALHKAEDERQALTAELEVLRADNRRLAGGKFPVAVNPRDPAPLGRVPAWQPHPTAVRSLAISPDGRRVATTSGAVTRVWDANTGAQLQEWFRKDGSVRQVVFTIDSSSVAMLTGDGIQVAMVDTGRELRNLRWKGNTEGAMCFRPGTTRLLFAGTDHTLRLFDIVTAGQVLDLREEALVRCVAFSGDGRWLAIGKDNGEVAFTELNNQNEERTFQANKGAVLAVAFSPDAERVATAGADGVVHLWSSKTGQEVQALRGHNGPVTSLAFSRDGLRLAAGGGSKARAWNADSGKELLAVDTRAEDVAGVAFDVTGKRLFISQGNAVRVCEMEPGTR